MSACACINIRGSDPPPKLRSQHLNNMGGIVANLLGFQENEAQKSLKMFLMVLPSMYE